MTKSEILRARWVTLAALALVFGLYLYTSTTWNPWISVLTALLMAILLTVALEYWLRLFSKPALNEHSVTLDSRRPEGFEASIQTALVHLRRLMEAHSEKEILETVMQAGMEIMGAEGASFVPYDEWGQSLPALTTGSIPALALQSWRQRLSLPETRQICKNCETLHGDSGCVLLSASKDTSSKVRCFTLSNSGWEVGVINFYFHDKSLPSLEEQSFFENVREAAGQGLENLQSRDQEIAALHYLQTINSSKSDLSVLLNNLIANVQRAMDVDFATLYLPSGIPGELNANAQSFSRTKIEPEHTESLPDRAFMEGIWKSVLNTGQSLSLDHVSVNKKEKWKTLFAVPLIWQNEAPVGVLILGSSTNQAFTQRHLALLETLAGQAALLIQNAKLMVQVEFQAVVDERTRLAREIHDGLAQTLAFLKMQAAQMQDFLARGETEKLTNTLQANYRTLSDAYIDARQAIDNLRRTPSSNLREWIGQVAADFEQTSGLKISVSVDEFSAEYPVNVQAQLIRVVQEALSNVRKHAKASEVSIRGIQDGESYIIEVRDNGTGFSPIVNENELNSHYGLQGMRERSENIGAEFQITSQPGDGTCVSLRLPAVIKEDV